MPPSPSRRRMRLVTVLVSLPLLLEAGAYVGGRVLQRKWGMYEDPTRVAAGRPTRDYEHYLQVRDPELGWPYPYELGGPAYDVDGSIRLPANEALPGQAPLVSLYGDSYTRALSNVVPAESWPNRVAASLGRPVKNFGVSGYGSDQAYLRFLRNREDRAPIVVLGHMAENMTRNLTRLRDLTGGGGQGFAFKPRFVLGEGGRVELLPMPRLSPSEYRRLVGLEEPPFVLEHESFQAEGATGAVRLRFPFTVALARNLGYWRFRSRVGRYPEYLPFYAKDHPLGGYAITRGILRAFAERARADGRRPIVVLFPGLTDTEYAQRTGVQLFAELAADLRAGGVEVIDFLPTLLAHLGAREARTAFHEHHYTGEIEPLVAREVLRQLGTVALPLADGR